LPSDPFDCQHLRGESDMVRSVMTIEQLAEYLQIGKRSLYKLAREGEIPAKKILNKWRFDRQQIDAWIRQQGGPEG
jgi:excisionase family DNA binding protein